MKLHNELPPIKSRDYVAVEAMEKIEPEEKALFGKNLERD